MWIWKPYAKIAKKIAGRFNFFWKITNVGIFRL